jgi:hypothetical protein
MRRRSNVRSLEVEPRVVLSPDFDLWVEEMGLLAASEGTQALIGVVMHFASVEAVRALSGQPTVWAGLWVQAQYGDRQRLLQGLLAGGYGVS